ncbi:3-hydroxyacyl-CoA dehydrogenase [Rhodovibrio salinarum]|uniref:3-hydroxyacyl-CoA dehydrogenase n=1 Tax=Rhodovibrio salinarum TaxID=1087 RepID=A0A934QFR6_9PROT|nr:3-hydroxyacyl-CoA dehydrogenase [Rhodovibrio salinarum]MBK1696141.1 3-hydroxyacyl-CoA dehydrogenase [Rhodovibrio salinarum]
MTGHIGIVGAGLVGAGWAIVFARAGHDVRVFDGAEATLAALPGRLDTALADLKQSGLISDPAAIRNRITIVETLGGALAGAQYVQESVFERTDVKRALYEQIDPLLGPGTLVGSSSSGIPASAFTGGMAHADRYLIVHPVNPPYLVPVVELVPSPATSEATVAQARELMTQVGQVPVHVRGEPQGFILNRLQGALLREAWALFEEGHASVADIDKTVSHGLGLRWSFMGPFETIDLNAPGGVRDYAERLGGLYLDIARDRTDPQPWNEELVARVEAERRACLPEQDLQTRGAWRDRRLMALAAHKTAAEQKDGT